MSQNQPKLQILIVDDDETIVETLSYNLKRHGYDLAVFNNAMDLFSKLETLNPDLMICDWVLPDLHGPEIVKLLREKGCQFPILMLTGQTGPSRVAQGLAAGADDYLAKPFSIIELMARVQALLRRSGNIKSETPKDKIVQHGNLVLDPVAKRVSMNGKSVEVSPKEFMLLKFFMENVDKTLSTEVLLNKVWGPDFTGDTKTVAVHIRWLRQKLEDDPKNPTLLETVQRSGYRLNKIETKEVQTH